MSDIYIVYAKEDRSVAERLHALLSEQWNTWWDDKIVGEWHKVIEAEIQKTHCIVPLFSKFSREKSSVLDELTIGRNVGKNIIPVKLDDSNPPYSFGTYSSVDMRGWNGGVDSPGFRQLQRRINSTVPPRAIPKRPMLISDGKVPLPSLFMSVSSHETQIPPNDAIQALRILNIPTILVSAYDLVARRNPESLIHMLTEYRENGGFVLIDSGNYEKCRFGTRRWKQHDLNEVLAHVPHDWAFCFDVMKPKHNPDRAVDEIVEAVHLAQTFTAAPVLPIVHAPKMAQGGYKLSYVPRIVREVAEKLEPPLIAVPERELGAGLIARAKMVRLIREELNKLPYYQPLHLLGTGHPWSIAVLAAAGADTFDGLEWCRFTLDIDAEIVCHFHHCDLLADLGDGSIGYAGHVAFHNLGYFNSFGKIMRDMFDQGSVESFVRGVISKKAFLKLKEQFPELFK